ncbi:hypothetical protein LCGC14_0520940 [marine sediment metagenome]|uniref:Right handed beta helix domain-containing protein n=1 Tax=marine sediment metagenome TaxID=412755 RepID=A0A0F9UJW4_9ZZZZ|nr:hypothetical protein [Phycisphaerae bacterium]
MAVRYIDKVLNLSDIKNLPDATGIGSFGGQIYFHDGSTQVALGISLPSVNYFVDGDNGADTNDGKSWGNAFVTIQAGIDACSQGDRVYVKPLEGDASDGDTDPDSYAELLTLGAGKDGVAIIGVSRGLAQGAQPQLKIGGSSTTPMIKVEAFGCLIHNITINGASSTGGGIEIHGDGSTKDAGGLVVSNCHIKNCKASGNAATGGGISWTTNGSAWYVTIVNCEFIDNRAGIVMRGTGNSIPRHVKIRACRFGSAVNTTVDADILVVASGIKDLFIEDCVFATVDVPAYASSPTAARYIELSAGTTGLISNCTFACQDSKTFGATGDGAVIPTTVRMAKNYYEAAAATSDQGLVGRT